VVRARIPHGGGFQRSEQRLERRRYGQVLIVEIAPVPIQGPGNAAGNDRSAIDPFPGGDNGWNCELSPYAQRVIQLSPGAGVTKLMVACQVADADGCVSAKKNFAPRC
jgi:hypothetical protein